MLDLQCVDQIFKSQLCKKFCVASLAHLTCIWEEKRQNYHVTPAVSNVELLSQMRFTRTNKFSKRSSLPPLFLWSLRNEKRTEHWQRGLFWFSTSAGFFLRGPCDPLAITWQRAMILVTRMQTLLHWTMQLEVACISDYMIKKPDLQILQTRTNTGTGWTNPGMCCQKKLQIFHPWINSKLNSWTRPWATWCNFEAGSAFTMVFLEILSN